ncbi:MAG: hypothetical protein WKF84_21190 [Pyrinomonadaceae bacterium]
MLVWSVTRQTSGDRGLDESTRLFWQYIIAWLAANGEHSDDDAHGDVRALRRELSYF